MLQGGVGQKKLKWGGANTHTHASTHVHTHTHTHTHTPQQLTEIVYKQVRGDREVGSMCNRWVIPVAH